MAIVNARSTCIMLNIINKIKSLLPLPIITRGFLALLRTLTALFTADGSARHFGGAGERRIDL